MCTGTHPTQDSNSRNRNHGWVVFEKMDHASHGQAARTLHVTLWRAFRTYRAIHGVLEVVVT